MSVSEGGGWGLANFDCQTLTRHVVSIGNVRTEEGDGVNNLHNIITHFAKLLNWSILLCVLTFSSLRASVGDLCNIK